MGITLTKYSSKITWLMCGKLNYAIKKSNTKRKYDSPINSQSSNCDCFNMDKKLIEQQQRWLSLLLTLNTYHLIQFTQQYKQGDQMKNLFKLLLAVLPFTILSLTAVAVVDSTDILIKALIDKKVITEDDASGVRAEIASIRQDEEAARKSYNVTSKRAIRLSGYGQFRYTLSDDAAQNIGFEIKRFRLSIAGDPTPTVDFKAQLEFAGSKKAVTAVDAVPAKSKTDIFSKPLLLDVVIGYKLTQTDKLSAGQFYVPFGLESITSDASLDTINRSQATEKLVPGRDTGNQGRDIGVQLSGTSSLGTDRSLEYTAAILNGAGINVGDDNKRKDIAGHIIVKPGVDGLTVGGSYFSGATGAAKVTHRRTGYETTYLNGAWTVKGEYITGKDDVSKHGYYATLVRNITPVTQGVVRYDNVSTSAFKSTDTVKPTKVLTLGVNWFLSKDTLTRVVFNYERKREVGVQVPNDVILAQFQTSF